MSSFVTDTQALVKFMLGKKVINDACHKAFLAATAKYLDIPIITNDPLIISSKHVNVLD